MSSRPLVLIPAHNEAASLPTVTAELLGSGLDVTLLVVDDASTDETPIVLEELGVESLRLPVRCGPGGAVRVGLRRAASLGFERVVRVDGDGQHPAAEVATLLAELDRTGVDAVIGSRYLSGSYPTPPLRRLLQRGVASLVSTVTGRPWTDATSGFWAFGPRAVHWLGHHHPPGFSEPELLVLLSRAGMTVSEVAVEMRGRYAGRSSLTAGRVGLQIGRTILTLLLRRRIPLEGT